MILKHLLQTKNRIVTHTSTFKASSVYTRPLQTLGSFQKYQQQQYYYYQKPNKNKSSSYSSSSSSSWMNHTASFAMAAAAIMGITSSSSLFMESNNTTTNSTSLARRNSLRKQKRHYPYVIIGAGTTAYAAMEAILQNEPTADILILSDETALPRDDVEIRKDDQVPVESDALMDTYNEWRRHITSRLENEPDAYSSSPITLLLGKKDMFFDVEKNLILLQDGTEIQYNKCLVATAGKPRNFYVLDGNKISYTIKDRINNCTTLKDFEKLDALHLRKDDLLNITVVGGGFLGTEIACALATDPRNEGMKVQQVFVESAPISRYLPGYLSNCISERMKAIGVEALSDRLVTSVKPASTSDNNDSSINNSDSSAVRISLMGNVKEKLHTDYIVLCSTHIDPNVRIAKESCLEIDSKNGGIVVNSQLEAVSGLFVAGNAASYYDHSLGRRRVDMYDHSVNSGLAAGQNMSKSNGKMKNYNHQPMFRSNLAGINVLLEGVGDIDANLKTTGVWLNNKNQKHDRGIVYYMRGSKVVGVLLWNASDLLESARQLIHNQVVVNEPSDLKNAISIGPDHWLKLNVCKGLE